MINLKSAPIAPRTGENTYRHAVVIGSSIAGLTAARVLTNHFDHVTVIERDRLPEDLDFRKGVPQARHAHVLLLRGQMILEELFPGLRQELLDAGAVSINVGMELDFRMMGEWLPHFPSDMEATACSRPLLENTIYRRLAANPRVTFRPHTDVLQICAGDDHRQVRGVYLRDREGGDVEELAANLIVDTSGRNSQAPEWLQRLGYAPAKEITINAFAGYATRVFQIPADFAESWKGMYIMPQPHEGTRGGVILPLEGNQWHVSLAGMSGDYPPTDEEGFYEFARSLPSPRLYEAIKNAEPVGPIYGYRRAENRLRQYDQLSQYLEGFVLLGDSVFALNPVYGQGMTVAAISAMTLGEAITEQRRRHGDDDLTGLAQHFQQQLGKVLAMPWQTATNEDMRWPKTEGGRELDLPTRLIQKYFSQVMRAAPHNPTVVDAFYRVQHMVTPPTLLLRPDMMARVFTTNLSVRFSKS